MNRRVGRVREVRSGCLCVGAAGRGRVGSLGVKGESGSGSRSEEWFV